VEGSSASAAEGEALNPMDAAQKTMDDHGLKLKAASSANPSRRMGAWAD